MALYVTKQGDAWDGIAFTQMGDCACAKDLMWANQGQLDYFTFPAGITLTLPEPTAQADSTAPPWKRVNG